MGAINDWAGFGQERFQVNGANVLAAEALLGQAEINLGYTEVRSPIDGRIGIAIFTVGNLVGPSSGTLATIVREDPVYVIFQPSERDVINFKRRFVEPGVKNPQVTVHIQLPDGSAYPHPGLTNLLDVQVDTTTDTVAVRAQVPNPEGIFISGGVVGTVRGAPRSCRWSIRPAAMSWWSTRRRR